MCLVIINYVHYAASCMLQIIGLQEVLKNISGIKMGDGM